MSSTSVAIKLTIGNQVRRIPVERLVVGEDNQPSLRELKNLCVLYFCELADPLQKLTQDYSNFKVSLTYVDEENETIVLSTNVELVEALRFSSVPSDVDGIRFLRINAVVEPCGDGITVSSSKVTSSYLQSRTSLPLPSATAALQQPLKHLEQDTIGPKLTTTIENLTEREDKLSGERSKESQGEKQEESRNHFPKEEHIDEIIKKKNEKRKEHKEYLQNIASISPCTTLQPLLPNTASVTVAEHKDSTGYEDRTTPEDAKSSSVNSADFVSSFIQKAGHFISHLQIPLDQIEESFQNSNTSSAAKICIGTDAAEGINESLTRLPLPVEVQNNTRSKHGHASPTSRKKSENPMEALISLAQKAEKFVQGIQILPFEKHINMEKNQLSMKINEPLLKVLPEDYKDNVCCFGFDPNFIHARHQCDLCRCIPIIGFRWHAICPPLTPNISVSTMRRFANFDLCHSCYIHFRENLDDCSRSFEIPAEMRFHPVQYDRDCAFQTQKHVNPLEMYVRQLVRCLPRFPNDQSVVRLVDCAEVNQGIQKSLTELKMKKSQGDRQTNNEGISTEMQEASPLDSNALPNARVNNADQSLLSDDSDSFKVSSVVGAIEILPSVGSIRGPRSLLDTTEVKNLLQKEQTIISFTEGETEESVLHDSHASITLGSLTVSSVTDASESQQKDYNGNSHEVDTNVSLLLPAQAGERHATLVVDLESVPIDSTAFRDVSEETSFSCIEGVVMSEANTISAGKSEEYSLNSFNSTEKDDDSTESSGSTVESVSDDWDLVSHQ